MKIISRDEVLEQSSIGYKLLQTNICQNNKRSRENFLLDLLPKVHSGLGKERFLPKKANISSMNVLSNVSKLCLAN